MKKILLLVLITVFAITGTIKANPVDVNVAQNVGAKFLSATAKVQLRGNDLQLARTYSMNRGDAAFYVFNAPNGFVIVSADDCAYPILGYGDNGRQFDPNDIPIQLQDILQEYTEQIQYAVEHNIQPDETTAQQWRQVKANGMLSENRARTQVGPLLTTTWDQGQYYNAMCPEDAGGPDGHVYTGCVATAMAQIINYHGYPISGRGVHSYQSNYGELSMNFAESSYDYANMPDALTSNSTQEEIGSVAKLISDCGVAVNMGYGTGESSAYDQEARAALINFFKYSPNLSFAEKAFFTSDEWSAMLRADLDASHPVYYSGRGSGGHAFICDGYNTDGYYHFNFGWSGAGNDWYLLDAVNPLGMNFNSSQTAILGIVPDANGNVILGQMTGTSTFMVDEPLEFYHLMGHNLYEGNNYSTPCNDTVTFIPSNANSQIVLDVVAFDYQQVWLYDGTNTDNYAGLLYPEGIEYTAPIQTFYNNAATFVYSGNSYYDGFQLVVGFEDDCHYVSHVTVHNTLIDKEHAVSISWLDKNGASQWDLRYRRHDSPNSSYTILNTTENPCVITGLLMDNEYDFSVRAVCDQNHASGWSTGKKFKVDIPYWTDIVTEQPSGYIEDQNGNVEISSAEGLAWLSVLVNGFHGNQPNSFEGKTITLTADLDLDGYRWYPIGRGVYRSGGWTRFSGTFDGQGHSISNIYVKDNSSDLGLFGNVFQGRLKNIYLIGGSVSSECVFVATDPQYWLPSSAIGGLVGDANECYEISNCHSSVNVFGNGGAGSLCGTVTTDKQYIKTLIYNCSSTGSVTGRESCGGLIGRVYGNVDIYNCYSTGDVFIKDCDFQAWFYGRGGLIGNIQDRTSVFNCYSTGIVNKDSNYSNPIGKLIGNLDVKSHIHYLYTRDDINQEFDLLGQLVGDTSEIDTSNIVSFHHNDNTNALLTHVTIKNVVFDDLLDVLNAWTTEHNDPSIRTWMFDNNTSYPVFGDYYVPSCYNPTNLVVSNATIIGEPTIRTELSWNQIGNPEHWEVLYVAAEHEMTEGITVSVNNNPCFLTDIPLGIPMDFYVRAVCDNNNQSNWCGPITYIPDKLRWTEVVTSQPEGYIEDVNGNVYISSAEGLAWLSVLANGLNGYEYNSDRFYNSQIYLTSDIDLSTYRWTAIGIDWSTIFYCTSFDGNMHTIQGLYCNELIDNQGLFGCSDVSVKNLILKDCQVKGAAYVGSIAGYIMFGDIVNCAADGAVCGIEAVGGIVGRHLSTNNGNDPNNIIANVYYVGDVLCRSDITEVNTQRGYLGGICGTPFYDDITNGYFVGEIENSGIYLGVITSTGGYPNNVSNCYYKEFETTLEITSNCYTANNSSFSGSGTTWTLNTTPYVNGEFRSDLLDALNAWVDANNGNGEYLHWVADTNNENGGFPMLERQPAATAQISSMTSGWNWWSTYIEQEGMDGLSMLESSLGSDGVQIKSQTSSTDNYYAMMGENYWFGNLMGIVNESSYLVRVGSPCVSVMAGVPAESSSHPISVEPNWNWIGYPVSLVQDVNVALSGFVASGDDVLKSQDGSTTYYEGYGWFPDMAMEPGRGYLYRSNSGTGKTLTYSVPVGGGRETPHEPRQGRWLVDRHASAYNMTVIAVVSLDGVESSGEAMEMGAFVGGECRGSARLEYFVPTGRYYAVLTVTGEEGERVTFGMLDAGGVERYDGGPGVPFERDAVLGTLDNPYAVEFGSGAMADLHLYPNPVNGNDPVTLDIPEGEKIIMLTVTDLLGRTVCRAGGDTRVVTGLSNPGVYNIEVVTDRGDIRHGRIIVR